jgi:uncharacterized membrane protein YdjX (TVP38/TMEM64 family)
MPIASLMNTEYSGKRRYTLIAMVATFSVLVFLTFVFREPLWHKLLEFYAFAGDRERTARFVASFGKGAPVVFMAIQVLQVVFAPIPGEATGFIGGYIFGVAKGFLYSSIALAMGSLINFYIGRFLGKRYIRKLIPENYLRRFDTIVSREGAILIFALFVFPGFPKDYFCIFLGISALPFKLFILMAAIGRMPGTFMLSLQGGLLFEKSYGLMVPVMVISLVFVYLGFRYREPLYRWIEKQNRRNRS